VIVGAVVADVAPASSATQTAFPLEPAPVVAQPPPCPCCQGRGYLPAARGWADCTWCEGACRNPEWQP